MIVYQPINICIVTKPIQYVNVCNIADVEKKKSILIVVDNFKGSQALVDFIKCKKEWSEILLFDTLVAAVWYSVKHRNSFSNLYLHSDIGIRLGFLLYMLHKNNIYLYEEGWANYVNNLKKQYSCFRLLLCLLYHNIQAGLYLGSHPKVKGLYLNFPDVHKKIIPNFKKEISLKNSFIDNLNINDYSIFEYNFDDSVIDKDVILYLSSWEIDDNIYDLIKNDQRLKIIKPHPHRKQNDISSKFFDIVVDTGYMAEFVIQDLILKAKSILIYHQNSTSIVYFQNHPKISIINLSPIIEYEAFANAVKKEIADSDYN